MLMQSRKASCGRTVFALASQQKAKDVQRITTVSTSVDPSSEIWDSIRFGDLRCPHPRHDDHLCRSHPIVDEQPDAVKVRDRVPWASNIFGAKRQNDKFVLTKTHPERKRLTSCFLPAHFLMNESYTSNTSYVTYLWNSWVEWISGPFQPISGLPCVRCTFQYLRKRIQPTSIVAWCRKTTCFPTRIYPHHK